MTNLGDRKSTPDRASKAPRAVKSPGGVDLGGKPSEGTPKDKRLRETRAAEDKLSRARARAVTRSQGAGSLAAAGGGVSRPAAQVAMPVVAAAPVGKDGKPEWIPPWRRKKGDPGAADNAPADGKSGKKK